jgi:hypothetical protein
MTGTERRLRRAGWVTVAAAAVVLITGCGGTAAAAPAPAAPTVAVSGTPDMVMITLDDRGVSRAAQSVPIGSPVMLMVSNQGAATHRLSAQLPLRGLATADATAPAVAASPDSSGGFSVSVPAGHEVDVSFNPTARGEYAFEIDGQPAGAFHVG